MPKRSTTVRAIFGLVALSALAISLVSVPGVSQAATPHDEKAPTFYLSLGDSYSVGFQPTAIKPNRSNSGGCQPGGTAYVANDEQMHTRAPSGRAAVLDDLFDHWHNR